MSSRGTDAEITLFVEARARRGPGGSYLTDDPGIAGHRWQDELREHTRLRLALRVDEQSSDASGESIEGSIIALPYYVGLAPMIRRLPWLIASIDSAVRSSDVVGVKLPGLIGLIAVSRAHRRRKPIAIEVVGDIEDVLHSGVAGTAGAFLAPIVAGIVRRVVKRGHAVRYVTERVLQARYPPDPRATVVAFSDVRMDPPPTSSEPRAFVSGKVIAVGSQEQPYKGHQFLIEAVAVLAESDAQIHLELVGGGRYQPQLQDLANARNVGDRVRFVGHVAEREDLVRLLDTADVFAMPSMTEGLPRALVEAMVRGLPCIGTDVGGIPELLPADALVPPGDTDGLARLLRRALHDEVFRDRLRRAAQVTAERFRTETMESRRREWSASVDRLPALTRATS